MSEHVKLNDEVYFTTNFYHPSSGFSYAADATPRYLVHESGAALILQGNMTARTSLVGSYYGNFTASAANGFVDSRYYDVQVSGTVAGVSAFGSVKDFVLGDLYDANITQVSGINVSLPDFNTGGSGASAADVRAEMDANSLMFAAISGQALTATQVRTEMDANSLMFAAISGQALTATQVRTEMDANSLMFAAISGQALTATQVRTEMDANSLMFTAISGQALTATQVRAEMDANSKMFVAISGQALTATQVRTEMDLSSLKLTAISGSVAGLAGAAMRGTDNAATYTQLTSVSGSILLANVVQVSGQYVSPKTRYDANVTQVSGVNVSLSDFNTGGGSGASAADVRAEMDANSLMFTAISGQALTATQVRTEMDINSAKLIAISGSVAGLAGAAMRGTDNAATYTQLTSVSGSIMQANIVQVSGVNVSLSDFNTGGGASAANIRVEMDANSLMFTAISGQALTATQVRTEMDTNSVKLIAISGSVIDINTNLMAVSGSILDANIVQVSGYPVSTVGIIDANITQVSGQYVSIENFRADLSSIDNDIYFASIKYVSDETNLQDEYAVYWFKNDQPVSSGSLTNPRLSVYDAATGTAKFTGQSMSYASVNLGVVTHTESTNVISSGHPYLVEASGTIDGSLRSWRSIVGIDIV